MPVWTDYTTIPTVTPYTTYTTNNLQWTPVTYENKYLTQDMLDSAIDLMAHRIYKIITEHIALDITEEEFMNIIKES